MGIGRIRGHVLKVDPLLRHLQLYLRRGEGDWMQAPRLAVSVPPAAEMGLKLPEWWLLPTRSRAYNTADAFMRYVGTSLQEVRCYLLKP